MNGKRQATPFQSWLDWNPEHRMLYRFIISQLHYDGLSTIALVLSQSLHQVNHLKASNDLSQLVQMCVQWGLQTRNFNAFTPVVKPQASFPLANLPPSDMLSALSNNKCVYEAEIQLQENLVAKMKNHNRFGELALHGIVSQESPLIPEFPGSMCRPSGLLTPMTTPNRNQTSSIDLLSPMTSLPNINHSSSAVLVANSLSALVSARKDILPSVVQSQQLVSSDLAICESIPSPPTMTTLLHSEQTLEALSGNDASWCRDVRRNDVITGEVSHKREKSDESIMSVENESPKHLLSDSSSSAEPISVKSEDGSSTPPLLSSAEENEQGMFTPISSLNSWNCPKCEINVTNMADLASHIKVCLNGHGDNYCSECGRGYSSKASLQRHISVVHRKERNYECHICRKRFGQQIHVDVHMRLHTGEKPFVCHLCNDSFKQSAHLKRHMQCHVRAPTDFYKLQKHNTSPYKRTKSLSHRNNDIMMARNHSNEVMISSMHQQKEHTNPLSFPAYLMPGSISTSGPLSIENKFTSLHNELNQEIKFRRTSDAMESLRHGMNESAVLGELQNKYTMELIKLIGQATGDISR